MNVNDYIKSEVDRQHRDNYDDFQRAMVYARDVPLTAELDILMPRYLMTIAQLVEPDVNTWVVVGLNVSNLRRSEVSFLHGGTACPAAELPERWSRWLWLFDTMPLEGNEDEFIKMLLDIHPWEDGNGRTASILRNWMLGTLDDPTPLPYYYGDN